jgi:hypothetical protein
MADRSNVVISSTARDLPSHRREVMDACIRQGMFPSMMEHLPASDADAIRISLELVDNADLYVGIFAHRYGYVPAQHEISITEMEYDRAVARKIHCLIFIMDDAHPITIADVESEQLGKLNAFKDRLKTENIVNFFTSPADLRAHVINSLSQLRKPSTTQLQLVGQKQALYQALIDKDPKLAAMYFGAIAVLEQRDNPETLVLAAHNLREMMEKLPKYLDLPVSAKPLSLKEKVQDLIRRRDKAINNSSCHTEDGWQGEIDKPLRQFLREMDEFSGWFKESQPTRRQRIAKVIRGLDPSGRALPESLENKQLALWDRCNDFFQGVSHHTKDCTQEAFEEQLSILENFLLDRLSPRTFEDFAVIDKLIKEVEEGDQS